MNIYINLNDEKFDCYSDLKRYFKNKDLVSIDDLIDSIDELLSEREELKMELARIGAENVEDYYKECARIEKEEREWAYNCEQAEDKKLLEYEWIWLRH